MTRTRATLLIAAADVFCLACLFGMDRLCRELVENDSVRDFALSFPMGLLALLGGITVAVAPLALIASFLNHEGEPSGRNGEPAGRE